VTPSAAAFWDPSEYRSKSANKVSRSDVQERLLNYSSTDGSSMTLRFQVPAKATAFLQYVDQMTQFAKIGTYKRKEKNGLSIITFIPFLAKEQPNKKNTVYQ